MTAPPCTAATQACMSRQTEQPIHGNQRHPAWENPATALAAERYFEYEALASAG